MIITKDDTPVISVAEMRAADKYTIGKGIPSGELMRRAAQGIFDVGEVRGLWQDRKTIIVCGSGNNGGDGYALAEIMQAHDHDVTIMRVSEKFSEDGAYYYERCKRAGIKETAMPDIDSAKTADNDNCDNSCVKRTVLLTQYDVIVDCILGTGFAGTPREGTAAVISGINEAHDEGVYVVSVDINSGMNGDTGEGMTAVRSDLTVSIGFYKHGFFLGRAQELIAELTNVDIGIELHSTLSEHEDGH